MRPPHVTLSKSLTTNSLMKKFLLILNLVAISLMLFTGCMQVTQTAIPPIMDLNVQVLYPIETTEVVMGQSIKSIVKVVDSQGVVVKNAQVTVSFADPNNRRISNTAAIFGNGDVYRTNTWAIPHKMQAGNWTMTVEANVDGHKGTSSGTFLVKDSISEVLLGKYGFWVDAPSLNGIVPDLAKEQGDAQNGVIIWGGVKPAIHIFPESWLEVQWRQGNFNLATINDVREFMTGTLGNPGVNLIRSIESYKRTKFKNWDAWKVKVRGQFLRYDEQWIIFYVPEMNETYGLGTTVVLAPNGIDAFNVLTEGFEVHPEMHAHGSAPQPLPHMLPPVELAEPLPGTLFYGTNQPIVLKWSPAKKLAENEYYRVSIDYNYSEANPAVSYTTRATQFVLPESLYRIPNCGVFNWQVTLMQQIGTDKNGQLEGTPISFHSFYWYVLWRYPLGENAPFNPLCPNEQY